MRYNYLFREKVRAARKSGLSYSEICSKFNLPKSTVSIWCRKVRLSDDKLQRLLTKVKSNWVYAAHKRRESEASRRRQIFEEASKEIKKLTKKDIFLIGLALYWGEGTKYEGDVGFTNSDPDTIRMIMRFFRESCKVPERKFRARLSIHPKSRHKYNISEKKALCFWSKITKIPLSQFHKTSFYKNKKTKFKRGKIMPHGTLIIKVMNADLHRKIMGRINGIIKNI